MGPVRRRPVPCRRSTSRWRAATISRTLPISTTVLKVTYQISSVCCPCSPHHRSSAVGFPRSRFVSVSGNAYLTPLTAVGIECDTGQQDVNPQHAQYNAQEGKQYSLLQNVCANVCASYGLTFKEEEEELAAYKIQPNDLLSGQYGAYDVTDAGMMVDMVTGAVVDPLQFTAATLTFNSPPDHTALLESLNDAADLLLPRLQTEDGGSDLLEESLHSPASTGSSAIGQDGGQMTTPVEPTVDPFPEHSIALTRGFETR